jgi:hypothetical protein
MSGQYGISWFARHRGVDYVPDRTVENRRRISLGDDGSEPEPRNPKFADRSPINHGRDHRRACSHILESPLPHSLIDPCVDDDERDVAKRKEPSSTSCAGFTCYSGA